MCAHVCACVQSGVRAVGCARACVFARVRVCVRVHMCVCACTCVCARMHARLRLSFLTVLSTSCSLLCREGNWFWSKNSASTCAAPGGNPLDLSVLGLLLVSGQDTENCSVDGAQLLWQMQFGWWLLWRSVPQAVHCNHPGILVRRSTGGLCDEAGTMVGTAGQVFWIH